MVMLQKHLEDTKPWESVGSSTRKSLYKVQLLKTALCVDLVIEYKKKKNKKGQD